MDWSHITTLLIGLVPVLWGALAPVVTASITALVNAWTTKYVPRVLQGIIGTVFAAVSAGLTESGVGGDPAAGVVVGGVTGLAAQIYAALQPKNMLTSAPEPTKK